MSVKWYASIKENNLIVCGGLKVHNKIADTLNLKKQRIKTCYEIHFY